MYMYIINCIISDFLDKVKQQRKLSALFITDTDEKNGSRISAAAIVKPLFSRFRGSLEISVQQTLESLSVSCLVLCHFVNCVVDSVEVESL